MSHPCGPAGAIADWLRMARWILRDVNTLPGLGDRIPDRQNFRRLAAARCSARVQAGAAVGVRWPVSSSVDGESRCHPGAPAVTTVSGKPVPMLNSYQGMLCL